MEGEAIGEVCVMCGVRLTEMEGGAFWVAS